MANDGVMSYFAKIGLDASEFVGGIQKSQSSILSFYRDVSVSMAMTMQIFDRVIATVQKVGQSAAYLLDLSYQTGLTTDQLQRMQIVAAQSNTAFSSAAAGANRFILAIEEAKDVSSDAAKAFQAIGVDPEGRPISYVYDDAAAALIEVEDVTKRNTIAQTLYGKSYKDSLPFLDAWVNKQDEVQDEFILTNDELEKNARLWADIETYSIRAQNRIASGVAAIGGFFGDVIESYERDAILLYQKGEISAKRFEQLTGMTPEEYIKGLQIASDYGAGSFNFSESIAAGSFTNRWAGLDTNAIRIQELTDLIKDAEEEMAGAKTQEDYDKASKKFAEYTTMLKEFQATLAKTGSTLDSTIKKSSSWAENVVVGAKGSEMYSFLMNEMAAGTDYETALQKWTQGAPTRLNMEGTLGAEGVTSKADQVADDLDAEIDVREDKYAQIEQISLKHWTAEAEMARVAMQEMGDWWAQEVNFINGTVAHAQTITMTDGKANAEPIDFPEAVAPKLQSADFSGIAFTGGAGVKASEKSAGSKSTVDVNIEVKAKNDTEVVATSILSQGG